MTLCIKMVRIWVLLAVLPGVSLAAPGDQFKEAVKLLEGDDLALKIEAKAQEAEPREAALIRILGSMLQQCGNGESCDFMGPPQGAEWAELGSFLGQFVERKQFDGAGALFVCAVEHLKGMSEGEYLDCLKQAELVALRRAEE